MEVFDSKSDVYVADLQSHTFLRSPLLADSLVFETFPTFSPDGKYIYYCAAPRVKLPDDIRKEWISKIPLRRGGTVEDIANTAVYLGSDLSSYVSGQVIQVDGGMNM